MIKYLFSITLSLLLSFSYCHAQQSFPDLTGKSLAGQLIKFPSDIKGKFSLIGVAMSIKAQNDLNTWVEPVYQSLVNNIMFPINLYFIPMTGDVKVMSQDKIEAKMKEQLDTVLYKYVVVYPGQVSPYISTLKIEDKNKPYFFVVDPKGKIVYTTSGAYSDAKLEAITDKMSE
jgi:hypothetical protein